MAAPTHRLPTNRGCLLAVALACSGDVACAPSDEVFETQQLDVRPGEEICGGTLVSLDEESSRISQTIRLEWSSRLQFGFGEELVADECMGAGEIEEVAGCARGFGGDTEVFADLFSSSHELVHGLRRMHGLRGPPFFSEGLAELVGSRRPFSAQVLVVDASAVVRGPAELAFDVEVSEEHYRLGAHFLAWLSDREGEDAVMAFLRDPTFELEPPEPVAVADAFRVHFGDDLVAADQQWRSTASVRYDRGQWCAEDNWLDPDATEIVVAGDFDFAASDTLGPPGLHHLPSCLALSEPATLRVDIDVDELDVNIGLIGCPDGAGTGAAFHDKFVEAGTGPQELEFGACQWWIRIGNPQGVSGPYRLTLTRDPM